MLRLYMDKSLLETVKVEKEVIHIAGQETIQGVIRFDEEKIVVFEGGIAGFTSMNNLKDLVFQYYVVKDEAGESECFIFVISPNCTISSLNRVYIRPHLNNSILLSTVQISPKDIEDNYVVLFDEFDIVK